MVSRASPWMVFAVTAVMLLACYSGLSGNAPFPCAADKTCPQGLFCTGSPNAPVCQTSCDTPTIECGSTCADLTSDTANCGACGNACGSSCSSSKCQTPCDLLSNTGCTSPQVCEIAFQSTSVLWGTQCRALGTATVGATCSTTNDCASGLECLSTNSVSTCYALCDNTHVCPGGAKCNTNTNMPNGGGYCLPPAMCGMPNFNVPCTGPNGSYNCPSGASCNPSAQYPTSCHCDNNNPVSCAGVACTSSSPCTYPNWWCP
jgi:hypothetical protein